MYTRSTAEGVKNQSPYSSSAQHQFLAGIDRSVRHWLSYVRIHGDDQEALGQVVQHVLRTLHWCALMGIYPELTAELVIAWDHYMIQVGQWQVWEACLRDVISGVSGRISLERAHALNHRLAVIYFRSHMFAESLDVLKKNERLALAADSPALLAHTYDAMAETYLNALESDKAESYAKAVASLAQEIGDRLLEADSLINTARALADREEGRGEAEVYLQQALEIAQAEGNAPITAEALIFIGHLACMKNAFSEALQYYETALALVESYGDRAGVGVMFGNIGRVLMELQHYEEARRMLVDSVAILKELGNTPSATRTGEVLEELRRRQAQSKSAKH